MSEPFLAEIRIVGFDFAPRAWAFCDGQIMPINQNQELYSLLGITYGGDGMSTFALPDLRGRAPLHVGVGTDGTKYLLGEIGGVEGHILSVDEMPHHNHALNATNDTGTQQAPTDSLPAHSPPGAEAVYGSSGAPLDVSFHPSSIANGGGGQAHENMQPFLVLNFCIALQGILPPRN